MFGSDLGIEEETGASIGLFQEIGRKSRYPFEDGEASIGFQHK